MVSNETSEDMALFQQVPESRFFHWRAARFQKGPGKAFSPSQSTPITAFNDTLKALGT